MIRLNVVVEGQTEEAFGNRLLVPHLSECGVYPAFQLITGAKASTSRAYKGGWNSYAAVKFHLCRWMKSDDAADVWYTTMLDLYALPGDFPGCAEARLVADPNAKVALLEERFRSDLAADGFNRFIPYLQLHEFEALLLSSPQHLDWEFLEHQSAIDRLSELVAAFASPEHINGGYDTAPSKRIIREIPQYEFRKVSVGPLVAEKIGLPSLRGSCPHFHEWLEKLEQLNC